MMPFQTMMALVALSGTAAVPVGPLYGDTLAAMLKARDSAIRGVRIAATTKDGRAIVVVSGDPANGPGVVLRDAMGVSIGTVTLAGRGAADADRAAAFLARRIYVAGNLAEPDPAVPGAVRSIAGQRLVEAMLARFPDLITLAMHVALPGQPDRIIASSFGRIGKPGDRDDAKVVAGATLREVTDGGARLAVELPLLDRSGRTIGALSTSFHVPAGSDPASCFPRAIAVRDALQRSISSIEYLAR